MGRVKRQFNLEFKRKVVEEVRSGILTKVQAIRQYELSNNLIYRWMDEYDHGKFNNEATTQGALENKIAELERKVGQQTMEIELLKKAGEYYQRQLKGKSSGNIPLAASNGGAKS